MKIKTILFIWILVIAALSISSYLIVFYDSVIGFVGYFITIIFGSFVGYIAQSREESK